MVNSLSATQYLIILVCDAYVVWLLKHTILILLIITLIFKRRFLLSMQDEVLISHMINFVFKKKKYNQLMLEKQCLGANSYLILKDSFFFPNE